jgi:hypothetical protein
MGDGTGIIKTKIWVKILIIIIYWNGLECRRADTSSAIIPLE